MAESDFDPSTFPSSFESELPVRVAGASFLGIYLIWKAPSVMSA